MLHQPAFPEVESITLDDATILMFAPQPDALLMARAHALVRAFLLKEVRCSPQYRFIDQIEEDLVQDTLLEAAARTEPLESDRSSACGLLCRILQANILDARRRQSALKRGHGMERVTLDMAEDGLEYTGPQVDAGMRRGEWKAILEDELQRLPRDTSLMLRLRLLRGMEYPDIAIRRITWTADSVRKTIERALVGLRSRLEMRGIDQSFLDRS